MKKWFYFDINYIIHELKPMFKLKYLPQDIAAGATVACIAIPLSLAIAMASSLPPGLGLISAIIGGLIVAFLGGTSLAVTGPSITMALIVADVVAKHGLAGLLVSIVLCGALQIISGVFRLGRFAKVVPLPVIAAFTAGIGFIIFLGQIPKALQLPDPTKKQAIDIIVHIGNYITTTNMISLGLALITIILLRVIPRYFPKAPTALFAVALPTIIVYFAKIKGVNLVGDIPHSLSLPKLPDFSHITLWRDLITSSLTIFALACLETLLSSSAVDNMGKGNLHNSNQELIGQGVANSVVALFGGLPVTGVIARSTVNIAAGAKTRRSPIIHSLIILIIIYFCPKLVEIIPIAALAGILLNTGLSMMNMRQLAEFWKSDKLEVVIYLITFIAIVLSDLIDGIQAGMMTAFLIVGLRMLTTKISVRLWSNKHVMRISLIGNLTFWSYDRLTKLRNYAFSKPELKFVIFDFEELKDMDSTGAKHLLDITQEINNQRIKVIYHKLTTSQLNLLSSYQTDSIKLYEETLTESAIKDILEANNITHSANELLKHGMEKFLSHYVEDRKEFLKVLAKEQKPHTLLITCSDSRLNPNAFFSVGLGELFIVRNVGNVIPPSVDGNIHGEAAAIEFAVAELGIRNIVICAHSECGAIKAALATNEPANEGLRNWLKIIKVGFADNMPANTTEGVKLNLLNQMRNLQTYPLIKQLLDSKELLISAWVYDLHSSNILEWNNNNNKFETLSSSS